MGQEFSVVGKRLIRPDALGKATGATIYTIDIKLPRMLIGKVLRSPHPHAKILSIDITKAERLPGVKAVVTVKDLPKTQASPPSWESPLASDRVRYIGEAIAGVAAIDYDTAMEALDLIKVEYEELPAVFDVEEALRPDSPRIYQAESNISSGFNIVRGDVEQGFKEADVIVEDRFVTQRQVQCCMETDTCIASFDALGKLTIQSTFARLFDLRSHIAMVMDMPEHKVRIIQPQATGGHFGGRGSPVPQLYYVCSLLTKKSGLPVKIENTSEEEFTIGHPRMSAIIELKMGAKRDGTIIAKQTKVIIDQGAYLTPVAHALATVTAMRHENLYRFNNIKTEATLVFTNKTIPGPMRGFGNPEGHWALESVMDMLAEKLGMDPAEFRLKNAVRTGDVTAHGWEIRSGGLSECIEKATESVDWKRKRANKEPARGIGIGCGIHVAGLRIAGAPWFADASSCGAFIKVNYDGTVHLLSGEGEPGTGATTVLAQICAEELGVHFEDVTMAPADTDISPFCIGPVSSRVTTLSGNAIKEATADAKRQLFQVAAEKLQVDIEELESRDRKIFVKSKPEKAISIAEAASGSAYRPILGRGIFIPKQPGTDPETFYGDCAAAYSFAAQIAEVEVDTETGRVKVLNYVSACDLGKAINPTAAEGQIEGGTSLGIGYTLTEKYETVNGEVVNRRFSEYKIPTGLDLPPIKSILVETNEPRGPFGAKGVGEIVNVPTAPAIANAIYNAIGVRIKELPITPEKILRALEEKAKS